MTSAYNREMDMSHRTSDLNFSIKSRLMDMRKATNHPYLIEYPLTEDGVFYLVDEDLIEICGKMKVLDQMLNALLERKHKVLIFSQMTRMLDIIQDYCNHRVGQFIKYFLFKFYLSLSSK
jgi:ATP-dependent DNA helicase